jgi:hypothetical protein
VAAGNEGAKLIFAQSGTTDTYFNPGAALGFVVQNCEVYGINATDAGGNDGAIYIQGLNGAIIRNNYIHDCNKSNDISHCHGYEEYGCQNTQVIYNTFYNCTGGAVEAKTGCVGTTIAYNYIYSCGVGNTASSQSACVAFDGAEGGNDKTTPYNIHHNIFDSCGRTHRAEYFTNIIQYNGINWYNNTTYDPRAGSLSGALLNSANRLSKYYNNIILTTQSTGGSDVSGYQGKLNAAVGGFSVLDYNDYFPLNGNYAGMWGITTGGTYSTLAAWQSAIGGDAHALTVDPQFAPGSANIKAGGGSNQFKLASGSALVNAGRVGGASGGAPVNMGAWDGTVTQIGCNFTSGSAGSGNNVVPAAPTLSVS